MEDLKLIVLDNIKEIGEEVVNCSKRIADIIDHIHKGKSLKNIVHNNEKVLTLLRRK